MHEGLNNPYRPSARRGEVWYVDLDPTRGAEIQKQRPVIIVRRNVNSDGSWTTIIVPLTNSEGKIAGVVRPLIGAGRGSGLSKDSLAICDQVRCVDRLRLVNKIGSLTSLDMAAVVHGLFEILDLGGSY